MEGAYTVIFWDVSCSIPHAGNAYLAIRLAREATGSEENVSSVTYQEPAPIPPPPPVPTYGDVLIDAMTTIMKGALGTGMSAEDVRRASQIALTRARGIETRPGYYGRGKTAAMQLLENVPPYVAPQGYGDEVMRGVQIGDGNEQTNSFS